MIIALFLLSSGVASFSFGQIQPESPYRGGMKSQSQAGDWFPSARKGQFLELPLDYGDPTKGTFDLFYAVSDNFDQTKPTVFYFVGGPGVSEQMIKYEAAFSDFNFVYMSQRGMGFSRFRKLEQMYDVRNFSSELIVRDAEAVRAHLGLERMTVFGGSYGTVPATIYAHQYPDRTRGVVLEGVVFEGRDLWNSEYTKKQIQDYFDRLPTGLKKKVLAVEARDGIARDWFAKLVRKHMYKNDFAASATADLKVIFATSFVNALSIIKTNFPSTVEFKDSLYFGAFLYFQVGCQELGFSGPISSWVLQKNGKITAVPEDSLSKVCKSIPGMGERANRTYHAIDYPISVPVTYFEGTTDGATAPPLAMRHFKQVAKGNRQIIFAVNGGHAPVSECLLETSKPECADQDATRAIVKKAFLGEYIDSNMLKELRARRWVKGSSLRSKIPAR